MRRLILTAMIAGLLAPAGLHAQQVYKQGSKVILDLTVAAGMPAGAITSTSKTIIYDNYVPDNNVFGMINGINNDHAHPLNAEVYHKLEVSLTDGVAGTYTWADGFKYCKDLNEARSSDWRLPTQRELMLMYIFKPALEALTGTSFSQTLYWSATEASAPTSWHVNFSNGNTYLYVNSKPAPYRVRCVREIP